MGARASAQEPQQQNKPGERVIPIHVEGRDEPVIPKNINATFSSAQPERIFGHKPSHFTQFVNPEDKFRQQYQKQNVPPTHQPEHAKAHVPEQPIEQEAQEQQPIPQTSQPQKPSPLELIQMIQKDVLELMSQVENFSGQPRDKLYLYLDEMLTRNLIKLDNIETEGKENIRLARKEAIKCIESCISILEAKANANAAAASNMEVVLKQEETQNEPATLEISGIVKSGSLVRTPSANQVVIETPMEVTTESAAKPVEDEKSEPTATIVPPAPEAGDGSTITVQDETSQNKETTSDAKKEKKKGKKKDVTDNKTQD